MKFPIFRNMVLGTLLGAIIVGVGSQVLLSAEAEDTTPEPEKKAIEVLDASDLAENTSELIAYGIVEAVQDSPLVFQVNGTVEALYVKAGDFVEEGQAIALLDNAALKAQVDQASAGYDAMYNTYKSIEAGAPDYSIASARSNMEIAEETLESLKDARDGLEQIGEDTSELDLQIFIQEEILDQSFYGYQLAVSGATDTELAAQWAMVEQAAAGLDGIIATYNETVLRAPFAGEVSSLTLKKGDEIAPGQPVGIIVNRDNVEVVTYLSGKDAKTISVHNNVNIGGGYSGEVIGISSIVDEYTKKRKVRVRLDVLGSLIVGETVQMRFNQDTAPLVTLVPLSAVIFDDDAEYVLVYKGGVLEQVEVTTQKLRGDYIEIFKMPLLDIAADVSGLREGQEVNLTK